MVRVLPPFIVVLLFGLLLFIATPGLLFAQANASGELDKKTSFKPSGKIYGDLFINYNYNLEENFGSFRLNRLHFAYRYDFSENWYFNGMIETAMEDYEVISQGGDYNDITNLFEFCVGYKFDKLEGKIGLIGTQLNQIQEQLWKHRYVDKIYADKYGLAPTNDFGVLAMYQVTPAIKLDLAVTNGEGHKNLQSDSTYRFAGGATVKLNRMLLARVYADAVNYHGIVQSNIIGMLGVTHKAMTIGLEWNLQNNSQWQDGYRKNGCSAYLTAGLSEKLQFFSRYDYVTSNQPGEFSDHWNMENDGTLIITGLQYQVIKQILVAVNYRDWSPYRSSDNSASLIFLDMALNF